MTKQQPRAYRIVRHTSIPRKPGGDPNDAIELEPGSVVSVADLPKRIDIQRLVQRGAWVPEE